MLNIVLVEPEIPHNTGAIARTCACTGARLHLVKPLGFEISDKWVKRCGLDYWHLVDISVYENLEEYFSRNGDRDLWLALIAIKSDSNGKYGVFDLFTGEQLLDYEYDRVEGIEGYVYALKGETWTIYKTDYKYY